MFEESLNPASANKVRATLKWFDSRKGFGFVIPDNENLDAFLHITVLQKAGIDGLGEGASLLCRVERGSKGATVKEVVSVLDVGNDPKPFTSMNRDDDRGDVVELTGTVKWYKPDQGFGFVKADDGGKDIFVHSKLLRRYGMESIESRTPLLVKARITAKGRHAIDLQFL
jgi:CspA family cold shock protein